MYTPLLRNASLLCCALLSACIIPPTVVRHTRLAAYAALGDLPQNDLLTSERLISQLAVESGPMPPRYLEQLLVDDLARPRWPDAAYRAQLLTAAIRVASRYRAIFQEPKFPGFRADQPRLDLAEAERLVGLPPELRVRLYLAYGLFCFADLQHGRAQEFLNKAQQQADSPFLRALVNDAQAMVEQAAGRNDPARKLRAKAVTQAATYFRWGSHQANEWQEYSQILLSAMAQAATDQATDRLKLVWRRAAGVFDQHIPAAYQYVGTFRAAELLSQVGAGAQALKMLHDWPEQRQFETKHRFHSVAEATAWQCSLGTVYLNMGSPGDALQHLTYCKQHRPVADLMLEQNLALAHERQGGEPDLALARKYYQESRDRFEGIRVSFTQRSVDLAGLAMFFQSTFLRSYHALLRLPMLDRALVQTPADAPIRDLATVDQLLMAAEMVRARQFRDQLSRNLGVQEPAAVSVAALRARLAADEVLLYYVATADDLILIGVTSQVAWAQRILIPRSKLKAAVTALAEQLAAPTLRDGLKQLESATMELSHTVLPDDAFAALVRGKRRIVLVPEEAMSAVPFDLLSQPGATYRPLFADAELLMTPALSLFLGPHAAPQHPLRVLGLADPPIPDELKATVPPLSEAKAELLDALGADALSNPPRYDTSACTGQRHCILLGEAARREFLLTTDLTPYSVFHAATHGFLGGDVTSNIKEPAVLLFGGRGKPLIENFLLASEVDKLRLNANLVILSACHSGEGPSVVGEGVLALSRAFLFKSQSVLMTLWAVDSTATERIVASLYKQMSGNSWSPRELAHALWLAKREYIKDHEKGVQAEPLCRGLKLRSEVIPGPGASLADRPVLCTHPFFWAPLVLMAR